VAYICGEKGLEVGIECGGFGDGRLVLRTCKLGSRVMLYILIYIYIYTHIDMYLYVYICIYICIYV